MLDTSKRVTTTRKATSKMATPDSTSDSGIYIIQNTVNGKVYIGQAQDLHKRFGWHKAALKGNYHPNRHLQSAWNKDSEKVFKFFVLEYCPIDQLDKREQHYLDLYAIKDVSYNIAKDVVSPFRGVKFSDEHKQKLREANFGKTLSEDHRRKIGLSRRGQTPHNKGKHLSDEQRAKLKGKHLSEETKLKISDKAKGRQSPNKGKLMSDEQKQRISHTKKQQNLKGRPSPNKGKILSNEQKQRISDTLKETWRKRKQEDAKIASIASAND